MVESREFIKISKLQINNFVINFIYTLNESEREIEREIEEFGKICARLVEALQITTTM